MYNFPYGNSFENNLFFPLSLCPLELVYPLMRPQRPRLPETPSANITPELALILLTHGPLTIVDQMPLLVYPPHAVRDEPLAAAGAAVALLPRVDSLVNGLGLRSAEHFGAVGALVRLISSVYSHMKS